MKGNKKSTVTPVVLWIVVLLLSCVLVAVVVYHAFGGNSGFPPTSSVPPTGTPVPTSVPTVAPTFPPTTTPAPITSEYILYVDVEYYVKSTGITVNPEIQINGVREVEQTYPEMFMFWIRKLGFFTERYNTEIILVIDEHTDVARSVTVFGDEIEFSGLIEGTESEHHFKTVAIDHVPYGLHKIRIQLKITSGNIAGKTASVVTEILVDGVYGS